MKDPLKENTQYGRRSALEIVLYSLCPSHRTLLQKILKLTHQKHNLSLNLVHNPCCHHHVVQPQERSTLPSLFLTSSKADNRSPIYLLNDCDNQGHGGTTCKLTDCKSYCSSHLDPYRDGQHQVAQGSSRSHVQSCKVAAYPVSCFCVKKLHCNSCQSLAINRINKGVCPFASSISCPTSTLNPASLICCYRHNPHSCSCDSSCTCLAPVQHQVWEEGDEREGPSLDLPCPVLELQLSRSPSPPPLSPIPSDVNRNIEEKPPSLLHHRYEGDNMSLLQDNKEPLGEDKSQQVLGAGSAPKEELIWPTPERSQAEQTPIRCSPLDFVEQISEKLLTIKPLEKDMSLNFSANHIPKMDLHLSSLDSPSTEPYGDAHLSEIITTVLHTGRESDYNLNELLHLHQNSETKSPKPCAWRRQEGPVTGTALLDLSSARRQNIQLKRELSTLYCRNKLLPATSLKEGTAAPSLPSSSSSGTTSVKEEMKIETAVREIMVVGEQEGIFIPEDDTGLTVEEKGGSSEDRVMDIKTDGGKGEGGRAGARKDSEKADDVGWDEGETCVVKEEIKAVIAKDMKMETKKAKEWEERVTQKQEKEQVQQYFSPVIDLPSSLSSTHNTMDEVVSGSGFASKKDGDTCHGENKRVREKTTSTHITDNEQTSARKDVYPEQVRGKRKVRGVSHPCASKQAERSKRNIVPPQRFSSYVTEPRKMYYAACFSGSIFSHKAPVDDIFTASRSNATLSKTTECDNSLQSKELSLHTPGTKEGQTVFITSLEQPRPSNTEFQEQRPANPVSMAVTEKNLPKHDPQTRTDVGDSATRLNGRLKISPPKLNSSNSQKASKTCKVSSGLGVNTTNFTASVENPSNSQAQYNSPIKLMFFSPVRGEDGVKFTLKSAVIGPNGRGDETFDPCEESSWAGTPEKNMSLATVIAFPSSTCATSPAKSTAPSPQPSAIRLVEGAPPKCAVITETGLSTDILKAASERKDDPLPSHETTPPKRRPGRPKKLGPQLEKKVKRPIGRPPKQKVLDQPCASEKGGFQGVNASTAEGSDTEDKANKNLKITVVYGRSRRSRRTVQTEGCGRLQSELHEAAREANRCEEAVKCLHLQPLQSSIGSLIDTTSEWTEEMSSRPSKAWRLTPFSNSSIKCPKLQSAVTMRRPGRPAKIKISGISVTVTTVSPRQRKIQINRDVRETLENVSHRKKLLSELRSAKEPRTISINSSIDSHPTGEIHEARSGNEKEAQRPAPVRHSVRVRKPSIYLLHSVATSRSYSHSTALLRRSRQLLLNKANNQRKQEAQEKVEMANAQEPRQDKKRLCCDLSQVEGVSLNSIFPPGDTLRWWGPSAAEETLNQELSRRIRLISSTWVSDPMEKQEGSALNARMGRRSSNPSTKRLGHPSVVRMLFNCPASRPQSCSMEQLCSWFMQTTETQSLAIVKQTSTRNPYELMHYPRTTNRGIISPSPQAERLRKHVKKFAKVVPKSPVQHQQAQERLLNSLIRHPFPPRAVPNSLSERLPGWTDTVLGKYLTTLQRVKTKFLTRRERGKRPKNQRNNQEASLGWGFAAQKVPRQFKTALRARVNQFHSSTVANRTDGSDTDCTLSKGQRLSSKAWSPESLKECRVFLKKINSPDTEPTAEGGDSCTVTLDDGSPSAYSLDGRGGESARQNKAVKTLRKKRKKNRVVRRESDFSTQEQNWSVEGRQSGTWKRPGTICNESPQPPPVKMMRESRGT